ncbi:uncharacterized protein METZ01_LOCUS456100 [marine metagenome]|uniref:Uncharacterized protein n=1 Tax=marine metagenome TaxID=408172 RepID=A0A383A5U8_9ZZZZ
MLIASTEEQGIVKFRRHDDVEGVKKPLA